jgi:hypothetical protein
VPAPMILSRSRQWWRCSQTDREGATRWDSVRARVRAG